jgi:hypothetical protein
MRYCQFLLVKIINREVRRQIIFRSEEKKLLQVLLETRIKTGKPSADTNFCFWCELFRSISPLVKMFRTNWGHLY